MRNLTARLAFFAALLPPAALAQPAEAPAPALAHAEAPTSVPAPPPTQSAQPPAGPPPASAGATLPAPPSAPPLPPALPAAPTPPSVPLTPEPPKKPDAPFVRVYVIVKPTVAVASDAVESYGQPNANSITAAANPVLAAVRDEAHYTFQAAQSRFGIWFNEKEPVRGMIELDFWDVNRASPTVASVPRLRLAKVEWQLRESLLMIVGQDWDLHAPVAPHCYNVVSAGFQAGNTAAFRQQAIVIGRVGPVELGGAVGFPGNNNTPKDNVPEYARVPSFAARASILFGPAGRVGVSGIGNSWRFAPDQPNERRALAGSVAAFGDVTPLKDVNVRFEGYVGRNVANMAMFGIGQGNATDDIDEVGGFFSVKYKVVEGHSVYGTAGTARALNPSKVVPSYSYAAVPAGETPLASSATTAGTGPGIRWNRTARLGYEYRYSKPVAFIVEGFWYRTRHALNADFDVGRFESVRTAVGTEFGLLFTM